MNCHEFETRLHSLLDDRQRPETDSAISAHAADCEPCGQMLVGQRLLLAGLARGVPGNHLPEQFASKVVAGIQSQPIEAIVLQSSAVLQSPTSRRVWQVVAWIAATAAALAIAVSIFLSSQPRRGVNVAAGRQETGTRGGKPFEPLVAPPDRALAQRSADSHRASPLRSGESQRAGTGRIPLLPRTGYGVTLADMATSSIPQAVERIEEVERYAPGIRPIRVSFAVLWNALWRSIPGFGDEPDPKAWHGRLDTHPLV